MKQKKVLSFVLALCLVFALSVTALAANFSDVSSSHWANDEISDVVSRGIFLGTSETTFEPEADMTRAMFVTVISRLAAADVDNNAATNFTDVATGTYYTGAVSWGVSNNIVQGLSSTTFGPSQSITREQLATLIQRYVDFAGVTLPETVEAVEFTDADQISDYAKEAVTACQQAGLINGMEDGSYQPKATATRAQVAAIISRLAQIDNAITYTVTFESNGGSDVAAQKVKGGEVATRPANPTKSGASFDGWYTDSALTTEYDFSTPVQSNFTLYAKWNESGSSSGGSSGGSGGGGSSNPIVDNAADYFSTVNPFGSSATTNTERTDVAVVVRERSSNNTITVNLEPAVAGSALSMQYPLAEALVGSANTELNYGTIFQAASSNYVANSDGFTPEGSEEAYGYTAMAVNFAAVLDELDDADEIIVVQTNPALEMYAALGATNIEQDGSDWVKTSQDTVAAFKNNTGSLIIPDTAWGDEITIDIYNVRSNGSQGSRIARFVINNELSFDLAGAAWTGEGAEPATAYTDGVESSVATGTVEGTPTAQMTVSGSVNTTLPLEDEDDLYANMGSVLENGVPKTGDDFFGGNFTIVGVGLGEMLQSIGGLDEISNLTIIQQNPALEMFTKVEPSDPRISEVEGNWIKTATYEKSQILTGGDYALALNGQIATILVQDEAGNTLLKVEIDSSDLDFTKEINNVAALNQALKNAEEGAIIKLPRAFYNSLANATEPLVISEGATPVIIEGLSNQELPVGVYVQRGNIELRNVNVNIKDAEGAITGESPSDQIGIYVFDDTAKSALDSVILNACEVTMEGDFGTDPVIGIHVFGADGNAAASGSVKGCTVDLSGVKTESGKIDGIHIGSPAVTVEDNTVSGAIRGIVVSSLANESAINLDSNDVSVRSVDAESGFRTVGQYIVWYNNETAENGFGTAESTRVLPEALATWMESVEDGEAVYIWIGDGEEKWVKDGEEFVTYYWDGSQWVEYNSIFQMNDFAPYPYLEETYNVTDAYNVGWSYKADFDWTTERTGMEVGLKDAEGNLIIKYTADADQVAWQLDNKYVTEAGLSSAPFASSAADEITVETLKFLNGEGSYEDWTVEQGEAFDEWAPASCYVTVITADGEYTLTNTLN